MYIQLLTIAFIRFISLDLALIW